MPAKMKTVRYYRIDGVVKKRKPVTRAVVQLELAGRPQIIQLGIFGWVIEPGDNVSFIGTDDTETGKVMAIAYTNRTKGVRGKGEASEDSIVVSSVLCACLLAVFAFLSVVVFSVVSPIANPKIGIACAAISFLWLSYAAIKRTVTSYRANRYYDKWLDMLDEA